MSVAVRMSVLKPTTLPPTISSALTASITYSNDKYRKRSTVRYDDLVFWYPFDEDQWIDRRGLFQLTNEMPP